MERSAAARWSATTSLPAPTTSSKPWCRALATAESELSRAARRRVRLRLPADCDGRSRTTISRSPPARSHLLDYERETWKLACEQLKIGHARPATPIAPSSLHFHCRRQPLACGGRRGLSRLAAPAILAPAGCIEIHPLAAARPRLESLPSYAAPSPRREIGRIGSSTQPAILPAHCRGSVVSATQAKQLIRVGHSPDPDDAFMFHALANDCIDTGNYQFTHELVDIETLNRRRSRASWNSPRVSIHAYAFLHDKYDPLLLRREHGRRLRPDGRSPRNRARSTISERRRSPSPARSPAAFLALRLCLDKDFDHVVVPFDEIIEVVEQGRVPRQEDRRRPDHPRRPAHLRPKQPEARSSTSASGGRNSPACRSRSAPTPSARTSARRRSQDVQRLLVREHRVRPRPPRSRPRARPAIRPRPRPQPGRQVRRHVRERLDARLRRPRPRRRDAVPGDGLRTRRPAEAHHAGVSFSSVHAI